MDRGKKETGQESSGHDGAVVFHSFLRFADAPSPCQNGCKHNSHAS